MVHQIRPRNSASASMASRKISSMLPSLMRQVIVAFIVGVLAACASRAPAPAPGAPAAQEPAPVRLGPLGGPLAVPGTLSQYRSHWVPVAWEELPGWQDDALHEAWEAWLRNCERPAPAFAPLCPEARRLSIASEEEQRAWMQERLRPYRIESADGNANGLLTSYFEPELQAARVRGDGYEVPLYAPPPGLPARQPWYTREQIETRPEVQAQLAARVIAWVRDPIEALVLHIQGTGRLRVQEADGSTRLVRVAFAGTNNQPYQSVGKWLLERGLVRDATWPGISAWAQANPDRVQEMLWANPRYVFFREEPLDALAADAGPRGAQGVPLTPGRSIAVDRSSIPYGTPVWLASDGPSAHLARLVMAQDTGSAIVGAVRADYFAGSGEAAGELAGRLKQNLRLWALWPRQ
ncbi:murein transglycosylase A [Comamonas flocculans]|uniref:peptidoglycan lytic exotransglycosylase n=1 Tax=Comamonas flocculans TaxID=2597701 RepID=A0A5B8RTA9_9BURK|nr:MltA domain-containing protein [Comamonas flocculans]QEA12721.1 transglycosylase [Comamonas flocculans]